MHATTQLPVNLRNVIDQGVLNRLPLTFLPFVNQQLNQWDYLFPNERQSVERLLTYVADLSAAESTDLFREVVRLEDKMGVRNWQFSTAEQTIQNSSQLAGSPYFLEWRRAVQDVFDAADAHANKVNGPHRQTNRLVLIDIPADLQLDATTVWQRWKGAGTVVKLDMRAKPLDQTPFEFFLTGSNDASAPPGLIDVVRKGMEGRSPGADLWIIDAGEKLPKELLSACSPSTTTATPILLSYGRLDSLRQSFSHEMNTMRKDLADADAVFDKLRKVDVTPQCPPEVAADPATREFVRSLYLSGNGAVIFGNSFVEWAASEAFRRARPSFLAARFGVRTKPKPFTGVAVFDNPDQVNPLPAVNDLPGSAIDAHILALYIWLAAGRFAEYQSSTLCVCMAESLSEAYIVTPRGFTFKQAAEPLPINQLRSDLCAWMA